MYILTKKREQRKLKRPLIAYVTSLLTSIVMSIGVWCVQIYVFQAAADNESGFSPFSCQQLHGHEETKRHASAKSLSKSLPDTLCLRFAPILLTRAKTLKQKKTRDALIVASAQSCDSQTTSLWLWKLLFSAKKNSLDFPLPKKEAIQTLDRSESLMSYSPISWFIHQQKKTGKHEL